MATFAPTSYWLYLLECQGGVYYAGIALDVEQRFFQHVLGRGAKFTRARPPLRVLAACLYPTKGDALRAERVVKALPRDQKLAFFDNNASLGELQQPALGDPESSAARDQGTHALVLLRSDDS